jgi:hypothetical protein
VLFGDGADGVRAAGVGDDLDELQKIRYRLPRLAGPFSR